MNGRRLPDLRYDMERLDHLVSRLNSGDLLAVMLGTNDILFATEPDAEIAIQKMDSLLACLCSRRSPGDILVIAPPYIADENAADPLYRRFNEESRKMNEGLRHLTERFRTGFVNAGFWNIQLCFDMVHFSEEGHRVFAEKLGEYLREFFDGSDLLVRIKGLPPVYSGGVHSVGEIVRSMKVSRPLQSKRIILLDDLVFSGRTDLACRKLLKEAGAEEIFTVCMYGYNRPRE